MSELLTAYDQQARQRLSTIPWLSQLQMKGLQALQRHGFPNRHIENWKYTKVDELSLKPFLQPDKLNIPQPVKEIDVPLGLPIHLQNGQIFGVEELAARLPQGVIVQSLAQAIITHEDKVKPHLGQLLQHEQGFQALNTAFLDTGLFFYIPKGVNLPDPIVVSYWQDKAQQAVYNRLLIVAEEESQAIIIEAFQGAEDCSYLTNTATELFVGPRARIEHYKLQREGKLAYHLGDMWVKQAAESEVTSHLVSLGGKIARSDIHLFLQEEHARCLLNGLYAPTQNQHLDQQTQVFHLVPNCQSEQDYKGILKGHSRAVFNGQVVVSEGAQKTQAKQQNKNLLLSKQAEIDSKPQLEIYADDVICTHGATVGQIDEEALFYLATRGIDKQEAIHFLIHAFTTDNLRLMSQSALAKWIAENLDEQLRVD